MKQILISLLLLVAFSPTMLTAENTKDPLLTEKSTVTFEVNMDGLLLNLPVELRAHTVPKVTDANQTELSIGNIDISYEVKDAAGTPRKIAGWVEFEAGSTQCNVDKNLELSKQNAVTHQVKSVTKQFSNENFEGYVITSEYLTKNSIDGVYLEAYDRKASKCYVISLAVEGFDGFTNSEVRKALSPLTDTVKSSLIFYANHGADKQ